MIPRAVHHEPALAAARLGDKIVKPAETILRVIGLSGLRQPSTRSERMSNFRQFRVWATAAALLVLSSAGALAEENFFSRLFGGGGTTGSVTGPPQPGGWSGESGASGHPQMSREAILAAAANFRGCVEGLWPLASHRGISRQAFEQHTAALTPDLKIMDLVDSQPEFTKTFWDYLDLLVTDERIQKGRDLLTQHRATFDAVERTYGVDRHVIVAIWGVETRYGALAGERPVLRSTATLACVGRRQAFFRDEFLAALEIVARGDVQPEHFVGSWAGAFGATQFMPSAFKRYAVDFNGDGRRDTVDSVPDLVASTANMLKRLGWVSGQTWGYEIAVPQGFDYRMADSGREHTIQQWEQIGIRRPGGKPFPRTAEHAFLLAPVGARGPAFLMLKNFRVIMRYNPAEAYALAIGHLADRLRGGGPIDQPWPREDRALSRVERLELQQLLASRGFEVGEPDGRLGGRTRDAVRAFQARQGLVADGYASPDLLTRLRTP
jgi:membrane-bound lytic murein transglycosylase B